MKTYPITRTNGSVQNFDINCTWNSIRSIQQILKSINGVSSIKFGLGVEQLTFQYKAELCVVYNPDGQEGLRYRICPKMESESRLDLSTVHSAFANHRGVIAQLWFEFRSKEEN